MLFYVVLYLFFEFLGRLSTFCKDYAGLDYLTADLVRSGGYSAFKNVRKLHNDRFDLERTDTVTGGFDDIVNSSDVPEVTVLVLPRGIAGMIEAVVHARGGVFLVFEVLLEESERRTFVDPYADFTDFTGLGKLAFAVDKNDVVLRRWFAHRTFLDGSADKVCDGKRRFCLSEAFIDVKPGLFLEDPDNLRIDGFAGCRHMMNG